jgi:hypothetical protein
MHVRDRARELRHQAGRLDQVADALADRLIGPVGRDPGSDRERVLERAAVTDQKARVVEVASGVRPGR